MRNLTAATFALSMIAASAAFAQSTNSGTAAKSLGTTKAIGNAPVGHRQPTAADVGNEKNAADLSPEDKALDRKIKSICRGC